MKTINVLWTSGWDSTFRVLDAAVTKRIAIQPHYIIDRRRASHAVEVLTITLLTQMITTRYPYARIAPPVLTDRADIPPDPAIDAAFGRLWAQAHLGDQNGWLARYVRWKGVDGLELCVHDGDKSRQFIAPLATLVEEDGDSVYAVSPGDSDAARLFANFRFPLLDLTKLDMEEEARARGVLDIMDRTWFCHNPTPDGQPCGVCNPCTYTIEEGLARRLPEAALRRHGNRRRLVNRLWRRAARTATRTADRLGIR